MYMSTLNIGALLGAEAAILLVLFQRELSIVGNATTDG